MTLTRSQTLVLNAIKQLRSEQEDPIVATRNVVGDCVTVELVEIWDAQVVHPDGSGLVVVAALWANDAFVIGRAGTTIYSTRNAFLAALNNELLWTS